jgi:mono/diheme cytochrome c family protein
MKRTRSGFAAVLLGSLLGSLLGPILAAGSDIPRTDFPKPSAAEDYVLHCSACHTRDGRGSPELVPSLRNLTPLLALPRGREYLVRVPGVAQAPLSPSRLARLLNWVLAEYSGLDLQPRFSAAEVEALRASPLRDPKGFRAALTNQAEDPRAGD